MRTLRKIKTLALPCLLTIMLISALFPKASHAGLMDNCDATTILGHHYTGLSSGSGGLCLPTDWADLSAWFLAFALGIGGGLAVGLIIISGYKIMTSQGDPEKLEDGKETLTAAISGLLFILFSVLILRAIANNALRLDIFTGGPGQF